MKKTISHENQTMHNRVSAVPGISTTNTAPSIPLDVSRNGGTNEFANDLHENVAPSSKTNFTLKTTHPNKHWPYLYFNAVPDSTVQRRSTL